MRVFPLYDRDRVGSLSQRSGFIHHASFTIFLLHQPSNNASQTVSNYCKLVAIASRSYTGSLKPYLGTSQSLLLPAQTRLRPSVRAVAAQTSSGSQSQTMLLQSAFLCEGPVQSSHTLSNSRAISMTSPPQSPIHRRTSSITSDIYTSCRALQSRLSTNLSHSSLRALRTPTLLPSPSFPTDPKNLRAKEGKPEPAQILPQTPPRGARKRRRSVSNDESRDSAEEASRNGPSTPKRQRVAPPSIPLGLSLGDFDKLESSPRSLVSRPLSKAVATPLVRSKPTKPSKRDARPSLSVATINPATYSSSLVSLIVQKLSLNEENWNGRDSGKEDIDERWRQLLAEAERARGLRVRREMVIRRGRRERTSLGVLDGVWFPSKE